jgi:uncharacterized protein
VLDVLSIPCDVLLLTIVRWNILKPTNEEPAVNEPANKEPTVTSQPAVNPPKVSLASRLRLFLWKLVSLVLLLALVVSVALWKPWQAQVKAGDRTVTVTGNATITAEPDEFVFYPSYSFTNADKQTALGEMTAKSDEMVTKIKALGVPSSKIKVDSTNYGNVYYPNSTGDTTVNLSLTITINDKTLAQKVQDYLLTTSPSGNVTPQSSFSTAKEKALENQARDKAEADARARAEQSAKNLGFSVKAVKAVEDGSFDYLSGCGPSGLCSGANDLNAATSSTTQLQLQPGENELPYSVKVTFYIR